MTDQDPLDDRLRSYLRARADVPTPDGLLESAQATARPAQRAWWSWPRIAFALVAVMVAAVLIGTRVFNEPNHVAVAPSPSSGPVIGRSPAASAQVLPDATLQANGFPDTVLGLPVISVATARSLIAGGQHQGRAMAVGGWWSAGIFALGCPAPIVYMSDVQGYCSQTALAPTDANVTRSSQAFVAPLDALLPREVSETAGDREPWKGIESDAPERLQPQRVVLIGHVGDPRAWMCTAETFQSCRSEFVVDAFAWVEGRSIDAWNDHGGGPWNLSVQAARTAVATAVADGRTATLSVWTADEFPGVDPRIGVDPGTFWIARVVVGAPDPQGTAQLVEVLIDDATGAVRTLPMSFVPGTEPGEVQFLADGDFFHQDGQLSDLHAAIMDAAGKRLAQTYLQSLDNTPAVLPAGDYGVVSWWTDPNSRVAAPSPPLQPPCSGRVHVVSDAIATVAITWTVGSYPLCVIREGAPSSTTAP